MKVKIRDIEYDSEVEPILLILEPEDKDILFRMPEWAKRYLAYPESMSQEEAQAFLAAEERNVKNTE